MSTTFFVNSVFGLGTRATITNDNGLYVAQGVTVGSTDGYAITAGGSNISIQVDGTLYGDLGGLTVTGSSHMIVQVGANGSMGTDLTSGSAMHLTGFDGRIENSGTLNGSHAIQFLGNTHADVSNFE